jgi:CheY-like chemotaxis protein
MANKYWTGLKSFGPNWPAGHYKTMGQSTRLKPALILVVEDEALIRLELADELRDLGYILLEADGADEALILLDAYPAIAILLTDIKMLGSMDGVRLAHRVRERWPPVQIIVASGMLGTRFSDLPPGSILVPKPYRPEDIKKAVTYLTGRSRSLPTGPRPVGYP